MASKEKPKSIIDHCFFLLNIFDKISFFFFKSYIEFKNIIKIFKGHPLMENRVMNSNEIVLLYNTGTSFVIVHEKGGLFIFMHCIFEMSQKRLKLFL